MSTISSSPFEARLGHLEKQIRRQRLALVAMALGAAAALLAAFAPPADTITARAIRIVDASGKSSILIGAPPPTAGRLRKDAQTASIVFLDPAGHDRLIVGEEPNPVIAGKTYPRIAKAYGMLLHDQNGAERGGIGFFDNGRGVVSLDRANGDAVAMVANDATGFAGLTVNYDAKLGQYQEGVRLGTKGNTAWLALEDRAENERARLAVDGDGAPRLVTRAAGGTPSH